MSRVVAYVERRGGFCTRADVLAATSRREVDSALASGLIVWLSRGRYGLPDLDLAVATAHGMRGVLSHTSAALWHGWEVKESPERIHVTLPRRRHLGSSPPTVVRHRADLAPHEITDRIVTSASRTLLDCLRTLPFDSALTIADSALRRGLEPSILRALPYRYRGPGHGVVVRVAAEADSRAANPFESCLRAAALEVSELHVRPQQLIVGTRGTTRPDLVDDELRIVIEADSFLWHGGRKELKRDARRYNRLVTDGWLVLRFPYEDVMYRREDVIDLLRAAVDARIGSVANLRGAA